MSSRMIEGRFPMDFYLVIDFLCGFVLSNEVWANAPAFPAVGGERSQAPLRSAAAGSALNFGELGLAETSALLSNSVEISGFQKLVEEEQIGKHTQVGWTSAPLALWKLGLKKKKKKEKLLWS